MKRLITAFLLLVLIFSGCAPARFPDETDAFTFTDDLGRQVVLPGQPQRTACLLGSYADVWANAGGTVIAAPDDAWTDFALDMPEDAVVLGSAKHLSLELLLAAEPDFVLASSGTAAHLEWLDTLTAAGIPVAYFAVSDFGDYLRMLRLCTEITGREDLYRTMGTDIQTQIDQAMALAEHRIAEAGKAPSVLYLRVAASGIRVKNSRDNVLGEMLNSLGCENIADSDSLLLENLNLEHILLADPDYIFIVQQGDDTAGTQAMLDAFFRENPLWLELTAVREGRVFTLDKRRYSLKPNHLWGEAYLDLVELLWP